MMKHLPLSERTAQEVYDETMAFLRRQAASAMAARQRIPHPLDYMLSNQEEWNEARQRIENYNHSREAAAGAYEYAAIAMENTYVKIPQAEQDERDLHRFGDGI